MAFAATLHPPAGLDATFDFRTLVDDFRCRSTEWLAAHRAQMVREQRRARVRELAVTAVLDERGAIDETVGGHDGVSVRAARETVETARALVALPAVAAAAHAGTLSDAQLSAITRLADASSDAEWAVRAPNCAPADLERLARNRAKPTPQDARRRREARTLTWWWRADAGMLSIRGDLPDVDGALFETVMNRKVDGMRPAKSEAWDTRAHRGADALMDLIRNDTETTSAPRPLLVVEVPLRGPAQICGIPLPDSMVEQLRTSASIEPVLVDDRGGRIVVGRAEPAVSPKKLRSVLLRDAHCRWPGCTYRTGLAGHHLEPVSWGGDDSLANLAAVCARHHRLLIPQGPWVLTGNPNDPEGLRVVHRNRIGDHSRSPTPPPTPAGPDPL